MARLLLSTLFASALSLTQAQCGSKGPAIDSLDPAALKAGESKTLTLKFWMKERGLKGDDLAPNLHFDDGSNQRVVFWVGDGVAAKVDSLVQGQAYKVTFTYEAGDALVKGTATAIE